LIPHSCASASWVTPCAARSRRVFPPGIPGGGLDFVPCLFLSSAMSQLPFKISAWTPDGNHVEEELGEFANLVVATESWHNSKG
jgi:hypothetical protein